MTAEQALRLRAVRDYISRLPTDGEAQVDMSEMGGMSSDLRDCIVNGTPVSKPTMLNMGIIMGRRRKDPEEGSGNECRTVGCIAGITMALYPKEVQAECGYGDGANAEHVDTYDAIGRVLGLDRGTSRWLFFGYFRQRKPLEPLHRITVTDTCNAMDTLLNAREADTPEPVAI